jgi:hypothetical protein
VLDDGDAKKAQLATDTAPAYGDSDLAETITNLKRQADALISASRKTKFAVNGSSAKRKRRAKRTIFAALCWPTRNRSPTAPIRAS